MASQAEIEQALISLALLDEAVADLVVALPDDCFTNYIYRRALIILKEKRRKGELCDVFTVAAELEEAERKHIANAVIRGFASLDGRSKEALARQYIKTLMEYKIANDLSRKFKEFAAILATKPTSLETILSEAQSVIGEALSRYPANHSDPSLIEEIRPLFSQRQSVRTGIAQLDSALRSAMPGDFFVIAGRTSVGKTAFAIQLAVNSAIYGRRVMYVSLEMRRQEVLTRFFSHLGFIPVGWFFSPREAMIMPLAIAIKRFALLPIKVIDSSVYSSAFDIPQLVLAIQSHSPEIVIIDYLHLMAAAKNGGMVEALFDLSRELKQLALRYQCVIVGLSQINRTAQASEADIEQLYYSSALAHDASQIVMLRPKQTKEMKDSKFKIIELALVKNRNGPTLEVETAFYPSIMRFAEIPTLNPKPTRPKQAPVI